MGYTRPTTRSMNDPNSEDYIDRPDPPVLGGYGPWIGSAAAIAATLYGRGKYKANVAKLAADAEAKLKKDAAAKLTADADVYKGLGSSQENHLRRERLKNDEDVRNAVSEMATDAAAKLKAEAAAKLKADADLTADADVYKGLGSSQENYLIKQRLKNDEAVRDAVSEMTTDAAPTPKKMMELMDKGSTGIAKPKPANLSAFDDGGDIYRPLVDEVPEPLRPKTPQTVASSTPDVPVLTNVPEAPAPATFNFKTSTQKAFREWLKDTTDIVELENLRDSGTFPSDKLLDLNARISKLKKTTGVTPKADTTGEAKKKNDLTQTADTTGTPNVPELKNDPEKTKDRLVDLNLIAQTNNAKLEDYRKTRSEAARKQVPRPPENQQLYDSIIGRDKIGTNLLGNLLSWRQRPNANTANLDLITDPSIKKQKSFWDFLGKRTPKQAPAAIETIAKPVVPDPKIQSLVKRPFPLTPKGFQAQVRSGWKLHLGVDDANAKPIVEWLEANGINHKLGGQGEQQGKDMTVWLGYKDTAKYVAEEINRKFGSILKDAYGDVLNDDVQFSGKVWGRFDAPDPIRYHQYGSQGVPKLNSDVEASYGQKTRNGVELSHSPESLAKHNALLTSEYGDFFTGTNKGRSYNEARARGPIGTYPDPPPFKRTRPGSAEPERYKDFLSGRDLYELARIKSEGGKPFNRETGIGNRYTDRDIADWRNMRPGRKLPEPSNDWTPRPEGTIRIAHISPNTSVPEKIRRTGLDYTKQGLISGTTRIVDNKADLVAINADPRFANGIANIFDVPFDEYEKHNQVIKRATSRSAPGRLHPKYLTSQIVYEGGSPVYPGTVGRQLTNKGVREAASRKISQQTLENEMEGFAKAFPSRPQIPGTAPLRTSPAKQTIAERLGSFVNYFRFADDLGVSRSGKPSPPVYDSPQSTQVADRTFSPRSIWDRLTNKQRKDVLNTAESSYPDDLKQIEGILGRTSPQKPPNLLNSPDESVPSTPQPTPPDRLTRTVDEQQDALESMPANARGRLAAADTQRAKYRRLQQVRRDMITKRSEALSKLNATIRSDSRLDRKSPDYDEKLAAELTAKYNKKLLNLEQGTTTRRLKAEELKGEQFRNSGFNDTFRKVGGSILKLDTDMDLKGIGEESKALIQKTEKDWKSLNFADRANLMERYNVRSALEAKKFLMEDTINMESKRLEELSNLPDATEFDKTTFTNFQKFVNAWRIKYGYTVGPETSQIYGDATRDKFNSVRTQAGAPAQPRITGAPERNIEYNAAPGTMGYESVSTNAAIDTLRRRLNLPDGAKPGDVLASAGASSDPKNEQLANYIRDSMIPFDKKLTDVDLPQPKQKLLLNYYASKFNVNLSKIQKALKTLPQNAERKNFPDAAIEAITEAATKLGREDEIGPLAMWGALNRDEQIELWHKLNSADAGKGSSAMKVQNATKWSSKLVGRAEFPVLNETSASAKEMRLLKSPTPTLTPQEGDIINNRKQNIRIGDRWIKTVTDKNNNIPADAVSKIMDALENTKTFETPQLNIIANQLRSATTPEELNEILRSALGNTGGSGSFISQMFAAAPFAATPLLQSNSSREKESRPNAPRLTFAP